MHTLHLWKFKYQPFGIVNNTQSTEITNKWKKNALRFQHSSFNSIIYSCCHQLHLTLYGCIECIAAESNYDSIHEIGSKMSPIRVLSMQSEYLLFFYMHVFLPTRLHVNIMDNTKRWHISLHNNARDVKYVKRFFFLQMQINCKADNGLEINVDGKVKSWNDTEFIVMFVYDGYFFARFNWNENGKKCYFNL